MLAILCESNLTNFVKKASTEFTAYFVRQARAMVMLNPRLVSGDVGVGLNVRRMRERLLR